MKLADLKKISDDLGLQPIPTRNRKNKETGESYKNIVSNNCLYIFHNLLKVV